MNAASSMKRHALNNACTPKCCHDMQASTKIIMQIPAILKAVVYATDLLISYITREIILYSNPPHDKIDTIHQGTHDNTTVLLIQMHATSTSVAACIIAETGVGPSMASGSQ